MQLVLATHNRDKVREIKSLLSTLDLTILSLEDFPGSSEVVEDGSTLEENALKKARAARELTGLISLADDSGLEVDALDGAPGVFSSRFAGENATYADNNHKLLSALEGISEEQRTARFRCCMALALANKDSNRVQQFLSNRLSLSGTTSFPKPSGSGKTGADLPSGDDSVRKIDSQEVDALVTEGIVHGRITHEIRGDSGFGYDPVFEIPSTGKTFAEIGLAGKNRMSHRYRALIEMRELILMYELASEAQRPG